MLILADEQLSQEEKYECLELCLQRLKHHERELITRYYEKDKRAKIISRKNLAQEYGLTMKALSLRALLIREKLRICIESCLNCDHRQFNCNHHRGAGQVPLLFLAVLSIHYDSPYWRSAMFSLAMGRFDVLFGPALSGRSSLFFINRMPVLRRLALRRKGLRDLLTRRQLHGGPCATSASGRQCRSRTGQGRSISSPSCSTAESLWAGSALTHLHKA